MPTQRAGPHITNLTKAQRALRQLAPDAHKELKVASREIAERIVVHARGQASTPQQAKAAQSLRSRAGDTPTVALGSKAVPFALGAEFGGGRFRAGFPTPDGGYTSQFPPWRGNGTAAGYFLYPTVRNLGPWIGETYLEALDDAVAKAARSGSP